MSAKFPGVNATSFQKTRFFIVVRAGFKLVSTVLEPIMLYLNLKKQPDIDAEKRRLMVTQQAIRQGVTFFTDLTPNILTSLLSLRVFKQCNNPELMAILCGLAGEEFIGNLLLRPFLMTKVTSWWEGHHQPSPYPVTPSRKPFVHSVMFNTNYVNQAPFVYQARPGSIVVYTRPLLRTQPTATRIRLG